MMRMRLFHHGKWRSRFETKRKHPFGDFWHIHDDFAVKNATKTIFKAEKAPSYSSLHALSNDAKRCACLHGNRQENATAMALSIVIIYTIIEKQNHFGARAGSYQNLNVSKWAHPARNFGVTSIINLNFELCHTLFHTSAWTVGAANTFCVPTRSLTGTVQTHCATIHIH
jgi:hypothetical protein